MSLAYISANITPNPVYTGNQFIISVEIKEIGDAFVNENNIILLDEKGNMLTNSIEKRRTHKKVSLYTHKELSSMTHKQIREGD